LAYPSLYRLDIRLGEQRFAEADSLFTFRPGLEYPIDRTIGEVQRLVERRAKAPRWIKRVSLGSRDDP